jgi:protein-disulfide isomerase
MHEHARWRHVALVAAIAGAGISAYLLVQYLSGRGGVCVTGSGCDAVRLSAFAYPLSVPMPAFGLAFYAIAAALAWRTLRPDPIRGFSARALLALVGAAGVGVSVLLTGIEAFVIHAFCTWCLAQAGASLALGAAAFIGLRRRMEGEPPGAQQTRRIRRQAASQAEVERASLRRSGILAAGVTAFVVVGFLAAGALAGGANGTPPVASGGSILAPASAPRVGSGPVTVVEFADYQCPACAAVAPELQRLVDEGRITLVYRNFPLPQHQNAVLAARAAVAAGPQDMFWQLHDLLFASHASWESLSSSDATAYFARLAGQAGLDVARWQADLGTSTVADTVSSDAAAAANLHLNSTPSIFINARLYTGSLSLDALRSAVAAAD